MQSIVYTGIFVLTLTVACTDTPSVRLPDTQADIMIYGGMTGETGGDENQAGADLPIEQHPVQTMQCDVESCDAVDNDCDDKVDEGLFCSCGSDTSCYGGPFGTRGIGQCMDGTRFCDGSGEVWLECTDWVGPSDEVCDGFDNDCDGKVDELGDNMCGECGPLPEEVCDGMDNDCDGDIDEGVRNDCCDCGPPPEEVCDLVDNDCDTEIDEGVCAILPININDDCVEVECPATHPFPIACELEFQGSDPRGCVAHRPGSSVVYLQEGNRCGAGNVEGTLTCSEIEGERLNSMNCPINKPDATYTNSPSGCADTN